MASIQKVDLVNIDLNTGNIHRSFFSHAIGLKDNKGDAFGVRVFRDGEAVELTGASVQGVFMPPQGSPIAITSGNSVDGNEAYVVLPQACYDYDGQFTLAIKLVGDGVTGTMRIVDGVVSNTHASGTVAPTGTVPTYQEVLAVYDSMVETLEDYDETVATQNQQISDLKSALDAEDTLVNDLHSLVNYNYGTPRYRPENPSSTGSNALGFSRNNTKIVLSKSTVVSVNIYLRLSGDVTDTTSNAGLDSWTSGVTLKTGHQYRYALKLVSGTSKKGSSDTANTVPPIRCVPTGTHSGTGINTDDDGTKGESACVFTAEANKQYNLIVSIGKNYWYFTNAAMVATLEDLTESELVDIHEEIAEINDKLLIFTETKCKLVSGNITPGGSAGTNNEYLRTGSGTLKKIEDGDILSVTGDYEIENIHIFSTPTLMSKTNIATITVTDTHRVTIPDEYIGNYLGFTVIKTSMPGEDISAYCEDAEDHSKILHAENLSDKVSELENIVNGMETDNSVPGYYFDNDYLQDKVTAINTIGTGIGRNSVRTFFITDYHLEDNARNSPALIEYLINKTGIRNVIFGGDSMNHDYASKEGGLALICEFLEDFRKVREAGNMFLITGNHEMNNADGGHDSVEFSKSVPYNLFNEPNYFKITSLWESTGKNTNSFYIDDTAAKIRTYCIDCNNSGTILKPILDAVIPSFETVPEGFAVLIISHAGIGNATADESTTPPTYTVTSLAAAFEAIMETAAAMDSGISKTVEYVSGGTTYQYPVDFTDKQRTFIGAMVGHTHIDSYYIYDSKFPVIFTTCDTGAYRDTHPWREAGKISEQAFDVVQIDVATKHIYCTRIGYGADREFTFGEGAGPITE